MIISFAKTTDALLAGQKTVTRRDWSDKHAAKFKAGMLVDAWNYGPRVVTKNPHKVATIRLTADPYQELSKDLPSSQFQPEGFLWMTRNGLSEEVSNIVTDWETKPRLLWVVPFEVVS